MSDKHTTALIRASAFYLTGYLTEELLNGDEDELDSFIREHLWEPFEYWDVDNVYDQIEQLARSFEELMV